MLLQVLKDGSLNLVALVDLIHTPLNRLEFIVGLVLEDLALSLQVGQFHIDLLEDIKFAIRLENGFLQVFDLVIRLLRLLHNLVNAILIRYESVNDRVDELLNQRACFRLNIEPEKFETWVLSRQTLEVSADQTPLL